MITPKKPVLMRITTIPASMQVLLRGQISFMRENGFDVVMVSSEGKEVEALKMQEGAPHFVIPFTRVISPVKDLVCLFNLIRLMRKVKPDIVRTHTPKAGLIGMWAAFLTGVPVRLHTIAGLPWMETTGLMRSLLKAVEKLTFLPATMVFPNSNRQKDFLISNGIGKNKMEVLGNGSSNGIDTDHFFANEEVRSEAQRLRTNENVKEGWVWIFIGRLVKDKGLEELLDAFSAISQRYPDDRLWLLGNEEPELDPLSQRSAEVLHAHPKIKKWGFINDVRPYLSASDVLVFPSYREGFPNVPMQAGSMGCALILSDINGCNEIIEHGKTGLLIEPKNGPALSAAMMRLRETPGLKESLTEKTRDSIIQGFSQKKLWEILRLKYLFFLEKKKKRV